MFANFLKDCMLLWVFIEQNRYPRKLLFRCDDLLPQRYRWSPINTVCWWCLNSITGSTV